MTVIQPNSVSGINSITVQNGNSLAIHKADGSLIRTITGATGVTTFATASVGAAWTDFSQGGGLNIGLGASISNGSGNVLTFGTNGDDRVRINSDGRIAVNDTGNATYTSFSPCIALGDSGDSQPGLVIRGSGTSKNDISFCDNSGAEGDDGVSEGLLRYDHNGDYMCFHTADSERLRITSAGDVGISTLTPASKLHLYDTASDGLILQSPSGLHYIWAIQSSGNLSNGSLAGELGIRAQSGFSISANGGTGTQLRLDSSGRLLVGHTASEAMFYTGRIQVQGTSSSTSAITVKTNQNDSGGPAIVLGKSRGAVGGTTVVQNNDELGTIYFAGADGTDTNSRAAAIRCQVDGGPGGNDMPGRLIFMTTADGASTETERMRLDSQGNVLIGNLASGSANRTGVLVVETNNYNGIQIVRNSADASTPLLSLSKSRGTSSGAVTAVNNGDICGRIRFQGADGDELSDAAYIDCKIDAAPGNNDMAGRLIFYTSADGSSSPTSRLEINKDGYVYVKTGDLDVESGTVSDSKGDVRKVYKNEQGSTYTLVASDASKVIGAQNTVTVPASVFANGDMVSIVNYTGGNITITQGSSLTIYNSGDASTGSKTLATRGMATLWFPSGTTSYMSGTGIS